MKNALIGLVSSRKALVVMLVLAFTSAAVLSGRATWEQAEGLLWKIIGPWMLAQGLEDAAKHNVGKPTTPPVVVNTSISPPSS